MIYRETKHAETCGKIAFHGTASIGSASKVQMPRLAYLRPTTRSQFSCTGGEGGKENKREEEEQIARVVSLIG